MEHSFVTLAEAFWGLTLGIALGFVMAVLMDQFEAVYKAFYPLIVLTQTVPTVAIAPLLVLWFGYEMTPKVILIVITTFFPIAVGLLNGFRSADKDSIHLLRAMGAGRWQIFRYIKLPGAMSQFFAGLRISASYAVVGAVDLKGGSDTLALKNGANVIISSPGHTTARNACASAPAAPEAMNT